MTFLEARTESALETFLFPWLQEQVLQCGGLEDRMDDPSRLLKRGLIFEKTGEAVKGNAVDWVKISRKSVRGGRELSGRK